MIEFISIKDTVTNKSLHIIHHPYNTKCIVIGDSDPEEIRRVSVGKTIREWMKRIKNDYHR